MQMLTRIYKEDKDVLKEYLMSRTQDLSTDVLVTVSNIIQDVKNNKDEACLKYTREFDHVRYNGSDGRRVRYSDF